MALSHVVSEIFSVEKYRQLEISVKSRSRSLKVVQFDRLVIVWDTGLQICRDLETGL